MEAYLDNSATTKCAAEVIETAVKVMSDDYGNPSSKHMKGVEAEKYIRDAKEAIAFAVLGNETLFEASNNVPGATGASHPTVMGKISF